MDNHTITRAMILSAVSRGIKEMEDAPHRSVRRLADLGRQFSNTPFQNYLFSAMQELLANESSSYYDMITTLLRNSNHETLKTFGVNQGYMSWTYGAKKLQKKELQSGYAHPLTIFLRYDPTLSGGLSLKQIAAMVEQGKSMGIYSYYIRQEDSPDENYAIFELFENNPDCCFLWIRSTGRMTAAHVEFLKRCNNTVVVLPVKDKETLITSGLLQDQKVVFALYTLYNDEDVVHNRLHQSMDVCITAEACLCMMIASDDCTLSAGKWCYDSRLKQEYPVCITDYYSDAESITKNVCGHNNVLEIGADATILKPSACAGQPFDFDQPLDLNIQKFMPSIDPGDIPRNHFGKQV